MSALLQGSRRRGAPIWIVLALAGGLVAETAALVRMRGRANPAPEAMKAAPSADRASSAERQKGEPKPVASEASASVAERFRETLQHQPTAISTLVGRKPELGGAWGAYDPGSARFIAPNHALIEYNDGHEQGVLVLLIDDPERPETWTRLYDDPDGSLESGVEP